jgi:hypothetical protein
VVKERQTVTAETYRAEKIKEILQNVDLRKSKINRVRCVSLYYFTDESVKSKKQTKSVCWRKTNGSLGVMVSDDKCADS